MKDHEYHAALFHQKTVISSGSTGLPVKRDWVKKNELRYLNLSAPVFLLDHMHLVLDPQFELFEADLFCLFFFG